MPGYVIAKFLVTDPEKREQYSSRAREIMEKYSGKFLAGKDRMERLTGEDDGWKFTLIEFPSFEKARDFYSSPEYRDLIELRENAMKLDAVILEGA